MTLDEASLTQEFGALIESSRNSASDRLVQAYDEVRKRSRESWDAATMARKAREYLDANWNSHRLALADAKDVVLPGIKRWLQEHGLGQFSNKKLAQILETDDLPEEIHAVAKRIAEFAGLAVN